MPKITDNTFCLANGKHVWNFYPNEKTAEKTLSSTYFVHEEFTVMTFGEHRKLERKLLLTGPESITEKDWYEMLEVLPPRGWQQGRFNGRDIEFFFCAEFWTGPYTNQYIRYKGKFYRQMVDFTDKSTWFHNN